MLIERKIDLHTHSTASDGSDSPTKLLENAVSVGLSAVALCDHDTISGLEEFEQAAKYRDEIVYAELLGYIGKDGKDKFYPKK